ncbi:MAG: hypothetical protein JWQ76_3940 [Ramlibacter sp.]|nr:hypothetical protein [Ramlibacter sp.]
MSANPSANRQLVEKYFDLLMKKDLVGWAELLDDEVRQENPFAPAGIPEVYPNKEYILNFYGKTFKTRKDHVFTLDAIHETLDPSVVIVEARARSIIGEVNRVYEQRYVFVFKIRNGKVLVNREYFNPLAYLKAWDGITVDAVAALKS